MDADQFNRGARRSGPRRSAARMLVGLGLLLLPLPPAAVAAQTDCETPVIDTTGRLDTVAVGRAIEPLSIPATVRIRTFDSVAGGDLEATIEQFVDDCFSESIVSRTYLVLAVSVGDRQTTLRYGDAHGAQLDGEWSRISDSMSPSLASGELTTGVLTGVEGLVDALDAAAVVARIVPGTVFTDSSAAEGSNGFTLGMVGALAASLAVVVGVGTGVINRRKLQAQRHNLQGQLTEPLQTIGWVRERSGRLLAQSATWVPVLDGRARAAVDDARTTITVSAGAVETAAGLLAGAMPRGVASANRAQIAQAEERLRELSVVTDRAAADMDALERLAGHLDRLRLSITAKAGTLTTELTDALELASARATEGWEVDECRNRLDAARDRLGRVDVDEFARDLFSQSDEVEAVEAELFAVRHDLQSLPDRLTGLQEWAERSHEHGEAQRTRADEVERELNGIGLEHAPESWEWASGDPELARRRLAEAAARLDEVAELLAAQRWTEAGDVLEEIGLGHAQADTLLDGVDLLITDLAAARAAAADLVGSAEAALADARQFVVAHDADLPEHYDHDLVAVADALGVLRHELRAARPNFLRVAQTAMRTGRGLDGLVLDAEAEQNRTAAARRTLALEISEAHRAIDQVTRAVGWQLFPGSVSQELEELEAELHSFESLVEIAEISVEALAEASAHADRVADDAARLRNEVLARRRRHAGWVMTSGGTGRRSAR